MRELLNYLIILEGTEGMKDDMMMEKANIYAKKLYPYESDMQICKMLSTCRQRIRSGR